SRQDACFCYSPRPSLATNYRESGLVLRRYRAISRDVPSAYCCPIPDLGSPKPVKVGAGCRTPFPICPTCGPQLQNRPLPDEVHDLQRRAYFQRCCWQIGGPSDILEHVELPLRGAGDHHMDIEAWLQGLGLERYLPAFRDNEIDREVLPKLTSEDLREIGVAAIGHRRKLLEAIAALGASAPTAAVRAAVSDASAPADAGRRQITVMFCDLVGSTALSRRLDPEDLRDVIGAYHRCVADTVERFGGFVAKYMGDGVLAYFGYPQAHENDAERAVRAGLALVEA